MKNFIGELETFWSESWKTSKIRFIIEAIGTLLGVLACGLLNLGSDDPNMWLVLSLYGVSAVCLCYTSYMNKNAWIACLMAYYGLMTFVGFYNLV